MTRFEDQEFKEIWQFRLFRGCSPFTLPAAPNWFHRKMQTLMLGVRWDRIDKPEKRKR